MLQKISLLLLIVALSFTIAVGQSLDEQLSNNYRFEVRLKGPSHKGSKLLEIKIDKNNNYLAATFSATSYRYIHLNIYKLYTWEPVQKLRIKAKRIELYASEFDPDGKYLYANVDVYKNSYIQIDLSTGKITPVSCEQVPGNGCRPIEVRQYTTEGFTVGENYYIYKDEDFDNYIKVLVSKELYKLKNAKAETPDFLTDSDDSFASDSNVSSKSSAVSSLFTIYVDKDQLKNLTDYAYTKIKRFDILINDNLAKTFKFDKVTTSTVVLSKNDLKTLVSTGEWISGELRLSLKK